MKKRIKAIVKIIGRGYDLSYPTTVELPTRHDSRPEGIIKLTNVLKHLGVRKVIL